MCLERYQRKVTKSLAKLSCNVEWPCSTSLKLSMINNVKPTNFCKSFRSYILKPKSTWNKTLKGWDTDWDLSFLLSSWDVKFV